MATKTIVPLNVGIQFSKDASYEAAPGGRIFTLNYKQMEDKATKTKKAAPRPMVICTPVLDLPTCGNTALDSITRAAMEGYTESLARKLRAETEKGEDDSTERIEFDDADFALDSVIAHAEEKASSLKFSEQVISAWWKAEGETACTASYCAQFSKAPEDAATVKAVGNMAVLFLKLSAPTPDISLDVCKVLLHRISVIEDATSTTQAIRRKLEKRIADLERAQTLLVNEGAI